MSTSTRSRRALATLALALAVVAFPLGALASHDFGDVPDSNPFHADISALVASGVTSGCGGGNYCPSANVTREQMAAFLNRLGALAPGKTPVVNAAELGGLTASQFARSDVPVIGHYNCHGYQLLAMNGPFGYGTVTGRNAVTTTTQEFACSLALPNGAELTAIRAYVKDTSATEQLGDCELTRIELATSNTFTLASTPTSGIAFNSGPAVLEASAFHVVNNSQNAYAAHCAIAGEGGDVTIAAIQVEYEVTGVPVP